MDPNPDLKAGQLSMDRTQILALARRDIEQHFEALKRDFNGSYDSLGDINVDELVVDDLLMWYRVQVYKKGRGVVSDEDLVKYRQNVEMNRNPSRTALAASIAEIITGIKIKKEIKKDAKK